MEIDSEFWAFLVIFVILISGGYIAIKFDDASIFVGSLFASAVIWILSQ